MTIWISRELSVFNFERLDILCAWIGHPCEKLWPFQFLKRFCCSISSVTICDAPESDFRVISYVYLNLSRASVVQFRASRNVMHLNRTFEWKFMTIWISRELPLLNFERLDILCAWIGPSCDKLWPFEFLEGFRCSISSISIYYGPESNLSVISYDYLNFSRASVVQFRASRYVMRLNRTSVRYVMTIRICRELPLFNFESLEMWCAWIAHLCDKLWPFEFVETFRCSILSVSKCDASESHIRMKSYDDLNYSRASVVQFWASRNVIRLNRTFEWKVMTIWICRELPLLNFERLESDASDSDLRVISCNHLNFSRASGVQFRASRFVMRMNRTSEWKVMTIWIFRELPVFNFERLDILCAWIKPLCKKWWPFEFLESFRFSISSVSICDVPESDIREKSYDHLNFSRASVIQFRAPRYIMCRNRTFVW